MTNGVKAWSYSALSLYEICPAKFKYEKIDKLDYPTPDAFIRGRKVHKEAEHFLTRQTDDLAPSLETFRDLFFELRELEPFVEQQWAFKRDWSQTTWFGKDTWLRGALDAGVVYADNEADVIDFKTGKPRDGYDDQLRLFALMTFLRYPQVKNVNVRLWYVDTGDEVGPVTINRSIVTNAKSQWAQRVEPMFNDTVFAPRPNRFCNWCHFRASNGS
jgi:CRISPR/Cas system-associated exonuclease Cas4 (RecB family)